MQLSQRFIPDTSSITQLYEENAPALLAFLCQRAPSREDAEDLLVDIFVAAIEYKSFYQLSTDKQVAWLWRVARNKTIDAYRYTKIRQGVNLDTVVETIYADEKNAPEQETLRQEEYARLRTHLQHLSPLQQEVMRLRIADNLRYTEIAQIIGKREGAIRAIFSRTIGLLKIMYEKIEKEVTYDR